MIRKFVIVSQDLSGLGWCKKLQEEGEQVVLLKGMGPDEKDPNEFRKVGEGLVDMPQFDKETVAKLMGPATYWIFDRNYFPGFADQLRADGQRVFGTTKLSERMENDRAFGVSVANACGLESPPTYEFTTIDEGVEFLEQHPDTAYVCKPNASEHNYSTFVPFREDPADANHELLCYLRNSPEMEKGYILQQRVPGVEVNVEVWVERGQPFFAFVDLENKRKMEGNTGEMAGCAGDIVFPIPMNSPIVARTVGKLLPYYVQRGYTGFADVNVIVGDNHTWFLEVCNRFGYSSHPNLFMNCAMDGFGNIMADWMEGNIDTIARRFRSGFGASITCFLEHKQAGIPLYMNPRWVKSFYPFDGYLSGSDVLLAGYSNEVGIFTDHDYTMEDAAEGALTKLRFNEAVSFPNMFYRHDLHRGDYPGAPVKRYSALKSMGLLS